MASLLRARSGVRAAIVASGGILGGALVAAALRAASAPSWTFVTACVIASCGAAWLSFAALVRTRTHARETSARAPRRHEAPDALDVAAFDRAARAALKSTRGQLLCVAIDNAYAIQASQGRAALLATSAGLVPVLRRLGPSAIVCALRDDELALLLVGAGSGEAIYAAERLHRSVHELSTSGALGAVPISVSVGIAATDAQHLDEALATARASLAQARRKGTGRTASTSEPPKISHVRLVRSVVPLARRAV